MPDKEDNNVKLRELMRDMRLEQKDISELTSYSLSTVKGWCATPGSKRYRKMQDRSFKTLLLALQASGRGR